MSPCVCVRVRLGGGGLGGVHDVCAALLAQTAPTHSVEAVALGKWCVSLCV